MKNNFEEKSLVEGLLDTDAEKHAAGISELKWAFPKTHNTINPNSDVSIRRRHGGMEVAFRKGVAKKFASDRLIFAIDEKRVYFTENDNGYKLGVTSNPGSDTRVIRTRHYELAEFIGDYVLQYDGDRKLRYIDRANMTGEGY